MILSHHQQHQLQRIETGLLGSDPQLTAMLGIFGKLSAGQTMPARVAATVCPHPGTSAPAPAGELTAARTRPARADR